MLTLKHFQLRLCNRYFSQTVRSLSSIQYFLARKKYTFQENGPPRKKTLTFELLSGRELTRVHGTDVVPFLQGLITNDMNHLESGNQKSMYTMFLNKSGRVLYELFIYKIADPQTYLIESDKTIGNELRRLLRMYRVRRNIQIDAIENEYSPWYAYHTNLNDDQEALNLKFNSKLNITSTLDPRIHNMGNRIIVPSDITFIDMVKSLGSNYYLAQPTQNFNYRSLRYDYGIAEGVDELPPGKCFPHEVNCDYLHGVSFQKGCYIGQECTARVQHTGVVRKRLMPVRLTSQLEDVDAEIQTPSGAVVGKIRGINGYKVLALLRLEPTFKNKELLIDGQPCYPIKPSWWPQENGIKRLSMN